MQISTNFGGQRSFSRGQAFNQPQGFRNDFLAQIQNQFQISEQQVKNLFDKVSKD